MFDYLVIGAGSGGMASARRAAAYGAKVAIAENSVLGGTCVNLGCVPKKIMWEAAHMREIISDAPDYGFKFSEPPTFDYPYLKKKRQEYISKLRVVYENNMKKENIEIIKGLVSFLDKNTVSIEGKKIQAKNILIAKGTSPTIPNTEGAREHALTSDDFFDLDSIPKSVIVVGSGYIAVELAHILRSLGSESVTMVIRKEKLLRSFDSMIQDYIMNAYKEDGINILTQSLVTKIVGNGPFKKKTNRTVPSSVTVCIKNNDGQEKTMDVDCIIYAVGRDPRLETLLVDKINLNLDELGYIKVDNYQNTNVPNIYALGDVCGKLMLAPVAVAAGRRLSDRLFGGKSDSFLSYENVASVVFSGIPSATVGLTQNEAEQKYGKDTIKVYKTKFNPLYYSMITNKKPTEYKVVCLKPEEMILGIHMIGKNSDEIMQGFATVVKMGGTKRDLDECVAIHPTSAEELVTLK